MATVVSTSAQNLQMSGGDDTIREKLEAAAVMANNIDEVEIVDALDVVGFNKLQISAKRYYNYGEDVHPSGLPTVNLYRGSPTTPYLWPISELVVRGIDHLYDYTTPLAMFESIYPITPIREGFMNVTSLPDTNSHRVGAETQLDKLGIDLGDITTQFNENPDSSAVYDAFIHLATDIASEKPEVIKNFMDFFTRKALVLLNRPLDTTYDEYFNSTGIAILAALSGTYSIREDHYASELTWTSIYVTKEVGSIGPVDHATRDIMPSYGTGTDPISGGPTNELDTSVITFKYQINTTQYMKVVVNRPKYTLFNTHILQRHEVFTLHDVVDPDYNGGFTIPLIYLDQSTTTAYEREVLVSEALSILIHTESRTKLKWYQTTAFKFFMVIVTILTAGTTIKEMVIAFGTMTILEFILYLVFTAIITIAITEVFKLLAELLGAEGAILAILALAVVKGISQGTFKSTALPNAAELLQSITSALSGVTAFLNDELSDIRAGFAGLEDEQEELESEIARINDLLGVNTSGSDDLTNALLMQPFENPSQYYTRRIHTKNPGVLSLGMIRTYVDRATTLPEVDAPIDLYI